MKFSILHITLATCIVIVSSCGINEKFSTDASEIKASNMLQIAEATEFLDQHGSEDFFLQKIHSPRYPKGMEFDHGSQFLYVANMWGKSLTESHATVIKRIAPKTFKVDKNIVLPNGYYSKSGEHANGLVEAAFTHDNRFAMVTRLQGCGKGGCGGINTGLAEQTGGGLLNIIDVRTQNPVLYVPTGGSGSKVIAQKPDSTIVYVTNWFTDDVSIIDIREAYEIEVGEDPRLSARALMGTIKFPKKSSPRGIAFSQDAKYMFVLGFSAKKIYIVSTETNKIIAETPRLIIDGKTLNFRHMVLNKDASIAYLSHMGGNSISRIDMKSFTDILDQLSSDKMTNLPSSIWDDILIPWKTAQGRFILAVNLGQYPKDHPEIGGSYYGHADPNTIVLDRSNECYLYVSFRSGNMNGSKALKQGKLDVIDVCNDRRVTSLLSGKGPTALAATPDGDILASSGFFDHHIYFFDIREVKDLYEELYGIPEFH